MDYKKLLEVYSAAFSNFDLDQDCTLMYEDENYQKKLFKLNQPAKLLKKYGKNLEKIRKINEDNEKLEKEIDQRLRQFIDIYNFNLRDQFNLHLGFRAQHLGFFNEYVSKIPELFNHFEEIPEFPKYGLKAHKITPDTLVDFLGYEHEQLVELTSIEQAMPYIDKQHIVYKHKDDKYPGGYYYRLVFIIMSNEIRQDYDKDQNSTLLRLYNSDEGITIAYMVVEDKNFVLEKISFEELFGDENE